MHTKSALTASCSPRSQNPEAQLAPAPHVTPQPPQLNTLLPVGVSQPGPALQSAVPTAQVKPLVLDRAGAGSTDVGDVSWVVMADPDGNEFCVLTPR